MADATASPKWCTAKLRRKNPAGDSQALAPPGKTESRNSWLRSRRSTIEPMNRASASAPSGPAASDPGEASIGNLSSREVGGAPTRQLDRALRHRWPACRAHAAARELESESRPSEQPHLESLPERRVRKPRAERAESFRQHAIRFRRLALLGRQRVGEFQHVAAE